MKMYLTGMVLASAFISSSVWAQSTLLSSGSLGSSGGFSTSTAAPAGTLNQNVPAAAPAAATPAVDASYPDESQRGLAATVSDQTKADATKAADVKKQSEDECTVAKQKAAAADADAAAKADAETKCKTADFTTATPKSSQWMFTDLGEDPATAKGVDVVKTVPGSTTVLPEGANSTESLYANSSLGGNTAPESPVDVKQVQTTTLSEADYRARYDPANVVVGGEGTGIVRCSSCPGGKWGVDTNDGSYVTTLNTARTESFATWDLPQSEAGKFNTGYLVDSSMPAGTTSAKLELASTMQEIGESKGMDQEAISNAIGDVNRESAWKTTAGTTTTSAYGLNQYVGDTWLADAKVDGVVQNRNNTFSQMDTGLQASQNRYDTYTSSPALQSQFSSSGQYDYVIHNAGSLSAAQSQINYAKGYYNSTAADGQAYATYAANNSTQGSVVTGKDGTSSFVAGNGTSTGYSGTTGSGSVGAITQQLVSGITGGNTAVGGLVNAIASGNTNDVIGIATQLALNTAITKLVNGSSSSSSGSSGTSSSTASSTAATGVVTANSVEYIKALAKACGKDLPATRDALMLMINQCQAVNGSAV